MSEVVITIETSEAHAWIRALEDAGCYGKANRIREVAGFPDTDCMVEDIMKYADTFGVD